MLITIFLLSLVFLISLVWYIAALEDRSRKYVALVTIGSLLLVCLLSLFEFQKTPQGSSLKAKIRYGLDIQGGTQFTVELGGDPSPTVRDQAVAVIRKRIDKMGLAEPIIQPAGSNRIIVQIPGVSEKDKEIYRNQLQKVAKLEFRLVHPKSEELIHAAKQNSASLPFDYEVLPLLDRDAAGKVTHRDILVKRRAEMSGRYVKTAFRNVDSVGRPVVDIEFTSEGQKLFGQLTGSHIGENMAIVLDNEVYTAPVIRGQILGNCEISGGNMTPVEAEELSSVLQNPLETPVRILDERSVDPSLGRSSVESGFHAGLIGMASVIIFALTYYRLAGVLAVFALGFNMVVLLGLLAQFGFTLTMPGVAGIILTIGMAVDANVLIYERIREELAWGKSVNVAINSGFNRAFSSILDANVTTIIAAAILFWQGSGPIQGFAVTLCLGVLSSMFSALVLTRTQFDWLLSAVHLKKLNMGQFFGGKKMVDFMGIRNIAMGASALCLLICAIAWSHRGAAVYGVDFSGGSLVTYAFEKKISDDDIRTTLPKTEILAQYMRSPSGKEEVLTMRLPTGEADKVDQALKQRFPEAGLRRLSQDNVESIIGHELQKKAFVAFALGMIGIFIYTMWRFETSYAVGAIVAIVHDVLISLGIYVLLGRELSLPVVGAILTVAGYSINDTIVIFDRIREGLTTSGKKKLSEVMNTSINQTLSRTLITAGTTFIAVLALYLFGGIAINDFALILLIGIVVGTYSSIFIASPIALMLDRSREH